MAVTKVEPLCFGFFNCYLLIGENGNILVDTAMPKNRMSLLAQVENRDVRLILLTHGHLDHVGNAAFLATKLGVPIALCQDDYPLITNKKLELSTDKAAGKIILPFLKIMAKRNKIETFVPVFVKEGDSLLNYGVDGVIVALPGHTDGSIGVLLSGEKLISGDATMDVFYSNRLEMRNSLQKIIKMGVSEIYPGHGDVLKSEDISHILQPKKNRAV
jgi:glyoxylase-like metal-dependent hydrolase (beta-lactamase superfamily II)